MLIFSTTHQMTFFGLATSKEDRLFLSEKLWKT
jgi:hypothetical protein